MKSIFLCLISFFTVSAIAGNELNIGEAVANRFDYQLKSSANQKELIKRLFDDVESQQLAKAFFKKTRTEGTPIPKSNVKGATLELLGQHPVKIDFSNLKEGRLIIQKVEIDLTKNPTLDEIYQKVSARKTAASLWISTAHAEDQNANESLGSLFGEVAKLYVSEKSPKKTEKVTIKVPTRFKFLMEGYGDGPLQAFSCDPKAGGLTEVKTGSSEVVTVEIQGPDVTGQRGNCEVKTSLHGSPGYGYEVAPWKCKSNSKDTDIFPTQYIEDMNFCCHESACTKDLRKYMEARPASSVTAPTSANESHSAK
jgi:hypothetical protein